jgi:competence protein ComEA
MAIRERLDALSRGELAGLVVIVALTLAGAGFWYVRSLPRPIDVGVRALAAASGAPATSASVSGSASPTPADIVVDVAGLVRRPGVYSFPAGSRVIDAIRRAGGPLPKANLSALNLAAPLTDGTQIVVSDGAAPAGGASGGATGSGGVPVVNINTATEPELESLTGVGPVTANAIIQYRTEHGPFATVDDLLNVSGIGPATLEELRPQVTV